MEIEIASGGSVTENHDKKNFYHYKVYGLSFRSEIKCPRLPVSEPGESAVEIALEKVPQSLSSPLACGNKFQAKPSQLLLTTDHIADYLITDGRKIRVQPKRKGAHWETVLSLLWGWAAGGLLQQRDRFPFHGSVLKSGNEGVVFCGHGGHGKSTMAMALVERGLYILDDNIAPLFFNDTAVYVHPGLPELKIYPEDVPESWQHLVPEKGAFRNSTKRLVDMTRWHWKISLPVNALFILSRSNGERKIRSLKGKEKIESLSRQIFCSKFTPGLGKTGRLFQFLLELAPHLEVIEIREPLEKGFPRVLADELIRNRFITV